MFRFLKGLLGPWKASGEAVGGLLETLKKNPEKVLERLGSEETGFRPQSQKCGNWLWALAAFKARDPPAQDGRTLRPGARATFGGFLQTGAASHELGFRVI